MEQFFPEMFCFFTETLVRNSDAFYVFC